MIDHVGQFRDASTKIVKQIVDELHLDEKEQKIKPLSLNEM